MWVKNTFSVLLSSGVELGVFICNDRLSGSKFAHSPNTRKANGTIFSIILVDKLVCFSTFGVVLLQFRSLVTRTTLAICFYHIYRVNLRLISVSRIWDCFSVRTFVCKPYSSSYIYCVRRYLNSSCYFVLTVVYFILVSCLLCQFRMLQLLFVTECC